MELRVLKYFLIVAREENFTRAAELLHVTQPTLSRQIAQLEEELGIQAFRRGNHHIELTEEGMLLKRRAQEIVDLAEKTQRDFVRQKEEIVGEISIGSGELRAMDDFGRLLAGFMAQNPRVRFSLFSGNADHIKERIENGTLDLGLLSMPVDLAKYEFLRFPAREEWGILTREDSALAEKNCVTPEDLAHVPLMMSGRTLVQHELANWFGDCFDHLNIVLTYNLVYNAAALVKAGMGCALCIRLNCSYDGLTFIPLSPVVDLGSALVWKKHQVYSPAVSALLAYIKKWMLAQNAVSS